MTASYRFSNNLPKTSSSGTGVGRSPKRQRVDDSEDEVEEVGASTEEIAGTILQIKLQDFMCHSKFEW